MQILAYSQFIRLIKQGDSSSTANIVDVLRRTAENQMGEVTNTLFDAGQALQTAVLDRMFATFAPATLNPEVLCRQSGEIFREVAGSLRFFLPGDSNRLAWLEVENKGEVYRLVKDLAKVLYLQPHEALVRMSEKGYGLPEFAALWAIEGVGHYYADCDRSDAPGPRNLLSPDNSRNVPSKALLMLHAGMGLSFADRLLGQMAPAVLGRDLGAQVSKFIYWCHLNSQLGYEGAALESLGLVARTLYPSMVHPIDRFLRQSHPASVAYFWHGVGRALYFAPVFFLPFFEDPWQELDKESIDEHSLQNVTAGLAWAVSLVNMRQPEIIERILPRKDSPRWLAFTNGILSSVIVREEVTPGAELLSRFVNHQSLDEPTRQLWDQFVRKPCEVGLERDYPALKRGHRLGELFQYRADIGKSVITRAPSGTK